MPTKDSDILAVRIKNDAKMRFIDRLERSGMSKTDFIMAVLDRWDAKDSGVTLFKDTHSKWYDKIHDTMAEKGYEDNDVDNLLHDLYMEVRDYPRAD